ncbi:g4687 [Coccomyxa viridis]|uniref:G4687 protein n=1 Tax=Coccomyxa viridis TaxID=1274662 RepID=A0ABP1FQW7_9CHLO
MAYSAENGRDYANGGSYRQQENYYTQEEAVIVDKAKRTHNETTQSAQRALKTAERTKELAANTLGELQHQGQKLDMIDRDLHDIDTDVDESKSILSYMRRCCLCFLCSCCCDGDKDVARDNARKTRIKEANKARTQEQEMLARANEHRKEASAAATTAQHAPANEEAQRDELFGQASAPKSGRVNIEERRRQRAAAQRSAASRIGEGLADEDREEIQEETQKQEDTFDQIGSALGDLKHMSHEMNSELKRQEKVLDAVTDHTDRSAYELQNVSQQAKKDFKVRPARQSGGIKRQALRAATKFV